ncbi:hypothetical protein GJ744_009648 [Endocarpon pusillum]|uniref:Uncharacterized protein n=1 Tax=Endocarpon pusillum TaxID=364733 RepID=A0A8H7AJ54_9EURO|nr:hypothetical protein GJ744_009648 [Endocarpon pusillum]
MLILAITAADLKPSTATWNLVAQGMGNGITASAVSQKFFKLKKATETENGVTPSTTSSAVAPTTIPKQQTKKNASAATGRKRKTVGTTEDAHKPAKKKAVRDKKQSEDDEEQVEDAELDAAVDENEDRADGIKVEEEADEDVSGSPA